MLDDVTDWDCGHDAARLLPWYVAETLSEAEQALVAAHLDECALCRADEVCERRLEEKITNDDDAVEYAPQPGLQKLLSRIEEMERELPVARRQKPGAGAPPPARHTRLVKWLVAAVVVQALGIGALAWRHTQQNLFAPRFETLSSPPPSVGGAPRIRVVFAPEVTVSRLKKMLESVDAVVVGGPSEAGVYTLALASSQARVETRLGELRAEPGVLFAEPQR